MSVALPQPLKLEPLPVRNTAPRVRFVFLDALRGLAALGIMLHHLERYGPLREPAAQVLPDWLVAFMQGGWIGVLLFFVMSGFVTAFSLRSTQITWRFAGMHFARRLVRLGLPYAVLVVLVLLLDMVMRVLLGLPSPIDNPPTWGQIAAHAFFLQDILGYDNFSTGLWFVCIEVQFCLLLLAMLGLAQWLSRGRSRAVQSAVLLAVLLPLTAVSLVVFGVYLDLECYGFYFVAILMLGMLGYWALQGSVPRWTFWALVAGFAMRLVWAFSPDLAFAVGFGLMVYLVGCAGRLETWLAQPVFQYLGKTSYSLFLIHYPVIHVVLVCGYLLTGDRPGPAVLWNFVAIIASLVAARFFYLLVEAPANRLASRLKRA